MNIKAITLFLLLIVSCGETAQVNGNVPTTVQPFIQSFEKASKDEGQSIKIVVNIEFVSIVPPQVGYCHFAAFEGDVPTIELDSGFWESADPLQREILIFHELGHCFLGRSHDDGEDGDRPKSIMYHKIFDKDQYKAHRKEYLHELFKGSGKHRDSLFEGEPQ